MDRKIIIEAFEEETKDWGLDYEKQTIDGRICYVDFNTGSLFGIFELGYERGIDDYSTRR